MKMHYKAALALGLILFAATPAAAQPVADTGPAILTGVAADEDENLQWAASVVVVTDLGAAGDYQGKLFGVAGGDPAMNGLYTYLAFYIAPGDGWKIFRVGDFLEYRVISETSGRVVLEVNESVIDSESVITARRRRLALTWTPGPDDAPPATVRVETVPAS